MKNPFSHAAVIFNILNNAKDSTRHKLIIICRILLTAVLLAFTIFFLRKIYEVPVNYTEIHAYGDGYMQNGELHFFLIRDYDRHKQSSDDFFRKKKFKYSENKGGIFIEGVFYNNDHQTFHSTWFCKDSTLYSTIEDILDTSYFRKQINLGETVYIMVKGTARQQLNIFHPTTKRSYEYLNDTLREISEYYHYGRSQVKWIENKYIFQNFWKIPIDTLFRYNQISANQHGYCMEAYLFASQGSEALPVFEELHGGTFEKPNPFTVFEDVSKMVEIVRICTQSIQFVKSLTIDYRCPTEFGRIVPEPDEYTSTSIRYTDPLKINKIAWDGLRFHVRFPDMENIQEIRIFALTTIATLLFTIIVTLIYKLLIRNWIRNWRQHPQHFFVTVILIIVISAILLLVWIYISDVDYNKLDFHTFENPIEWNK